MFSAAIDPDPQMMDVTLLMIKETLEENPRLMIKHKVVYEFVCKNLKPWSEGHLAYLKAESDGAYD